MPKTVTVTALTGRPDIFYIRENGLEFGVRITVNDAFAVHLLVLAGLPLCTLLSTFFGGCYSRNNVIKRIVDNFNWLDLGRAVTHLGSDSKRKGEEMNDDWLDWSPISVNFYIPNPLDTRVVKTPMRYQRIHLPNSHHIFTRWEYTFSGKLKRIQKDYLLNTVSPMHRMFAMQLVRICSIYVLVLVTNTLAGKSVSDHIILNQVFFQPYLTLWRTGSRSSFSFHCLPLWLAHDEETEAEGSRFHF